MMKDFRLQINLPKRLANPEVNFNNKSNLIHNNRKDIMQNDFANFSFLLNPSNYYLHKSQLNINFCGNNTLNLPVKKIQKILDEALPIIKNAKNPEDKAKLCDEALDNFYDTQMEWKKSIDIKNQKKQIDFINDFLHEAFSHLLELKHIYIEPFIDKEKSLPQNFDVLCENNFSSIKEIYKRYQLFLDTGLNNQGHTFLEIFNMIETPINKRIKANGIILTINNKDLISNMIPNMVDYKIYTVFMNVLHNAVKYTPDNGHIIVDFSVDKRRSSLLNFSVQDNGIGIPPSEIKKIIKGSRGSNAINLGIPGTGYGLKRVNKILNFIGLKIKIISPINPNLSDRPGTKIICQFPIQKVSDQSKC